MSSAMPRAVPARAATIGALALCVALGCTTEATPSTHPTPVTDALLTTARSWSPSPVNEATVRAELASITASVRAATKRTPQALPSELLRRTLFDDLRYVREVHDSALRFALLPAVLASRRGSCVGLGSVYLAVAEEMGWKATGVMMPGHFYVRIAEGGGKHYVELLHRGERMPDAWYPQRFPIPGGSAPEYGRPLEAREVAAIVEYNAGNARRVAGHLSDALRAYDAARTHFPDFAEAHASFGAVAQLLGNLDQAARAYRAAREAQPQLPGLADNMALLQAERAEADGGK